MTTVTTKTYNAHNIATALHDAGGKDIVIFCHGYRGTSVGPSRFFVRAANLLQEQGISSLRIDQYGSGNSDGDFYESSFTDWIATTKAVVDDYVSQGYRVALFGQSMGASTVICVAGATPKLHAMVAWVPDAKVVDTVKDPNAEYIEEGGQRVHPKFWLEAHIAGISQKLTQVTTPSYIVQCTGDEYVDQQNRDAIEHNAQANHTVENYDGYLHSSWTYDQATDIINKSVDFLVREFARPL